MNTSAHAHHSPRSIDDVALRATLHCLSGCAIGEVLGMLLGAAFGWPAGTTVAVAVALAFVSGFAMTMLPLLAGGISPRRAMALAFAADAASIALMEIVDNAVMLVVPGAMNAPLTSPLFWGSLLGALLVAGLAAYPLNRMLIVRGMGHAVLHGRQEHPRH